MKGSSQERPHAPDPDRLEVIVAVAFFTLALAGFTVFAVSASASGIRLAASSALFALLFAPWTALSVAVPKLSGLRIALLWMIPPALYTAYAGGLGEHVPARHLVALLVYGWIPCALLGWGWRSRPRTGPDGPPAPGQVARLLLAAAAFAFPAMAGLVRGIVLPVFPAVGQAARPEVELTPVLAVELALLLVVGLRRLSGVGFTFRLRPGDLGLAAAALVAFGAVGVPLGIEIGFLHYGPLLAGPADIAVRFLGIYVFIAVPEELLFRGMLQNTLETVLSRSHPGGGRVASLLLAAVIFGAAHLQHSPAPNGRYFLLASLAGLAYGFVWQRTRKVTASALTHAGVDLIWVVLFRAG